MLMLPIETRSHVNDMLIIVLDSVNIQRLREADPAEIDTKVCGKQLVNPTVMVCYEEPTPQFNRLMQGNDIKAILEYLGRGWKFQPDKGDHDRGPESIAKAN